MTQTIAQALKFGCDYLQASATPRLDAEILLAHALQNTITYLHTWSDTALTDSQKSLFQKFLSRRAQGEPVAYITGVKDFWTLQFQVNSSVLVPRPETELLIELILERKPAALKIADLGTGSGAIAVTLAHVCPDCEIIAVDISADSLQVAKTNAKHYQLQNIEFIESNWFENLKNETFDIIVSNPPYIEADDPHLKALELNFEPKHALVAEDHGLADIKKIIKTASRHLSTNGLLLIEHGFEQGAAVRTIFEESDYRAVKSFTDLAGLERVTMGSYHGH